jgi:hypothetical protein
MAATFQPGDVFERKHPFTWVVERHGEPDRDTERWRPGAWETKYIPPDDACAICHGEGTVKFTVVSVHTPPKYPTRVFFTRQFFMPDGKPYASSRLKNCIIAKFSKDIKAFPFLYEVEEL